MYKYTASSTTAVKFENKFNLITDTIAMYLHYVFSTAYLIWSPHHKKHAKHDAILQFITRLKFYSLNER